MNYYLGIDIGTFESKGVLTDRDGKIIASASRPHKMLVPQAGWAEHRPREDWWGDFVVICQQLLTDSDINPADIRSVACSAIGPCMLPVDDAGEPLMNGVLYGVDGRSADQITELTNLIGEDVLLERCGNALTTQSVGPKILWLKQNCPEIFSKTKKILTSTSFIVEQLTGRYVIDHYTAANFSPLYLVDQLDWSTELCPELIDTSLLPELLWSNEIAGTVTETAASATGLAVGTPVTTGTIDAAAEAVSVGVTGTGDMMVMYGSTIFIIMLSDKRIGDPRLWYAPWLFEGGHASMAGAATSGTLTHWFRDQFAKELTTEATTKDETFGILAAEAEAIPAGSEGLVFLPYFSGERTPIHDPSARGSWFGLNLTHTRGHLFRSLLEGIAMGTCHIIDTYRDIGHPPQRLLAVGGGTKNKVWSQATSDFARLPQEVCAKTIGASYGDAFLAALAVGDVSMKDIAKWNPVERVIKPMDNSACQKNYTVFKALYDNTQGLMKELGT